MGYWHFENDNLISPSGETVGKRKGENLYLTDGVGDLSTASDILRILNAHNDLVAACETAQGYLRLFRVSVRSADIEITTIDAVETVLDDTLEAALAAAKEGGA